MSLENIKESEARVLIEMQIRQEIDNNVDDYCLREDGTLCLRETSGEEKIEFREF
jgi:hypothetical protein